MSICYGSKYALSICYGSKYAVMVANTQSNLTLFSLMVSPSNSFSYWSKGLVKVMRMGGVSISRDIISPCDWPMKFLIFTPSSHCTNRLGKVSRVHLPTRPPLPTKFIIVTRDCRWAELTWAKNSITYPNPAPFSLFTKVGLYFCCVLVIPILTDAEHFHTAGAQKIVD